MEVGRCSLTFSTAAAMDATSPWRSRKPTAHLLVSRALPRLKLQEAPPPLQRIGRRAVVVDVERTGPRSLHVFLDLEPNRDVSGDNEEAGSRDDRYGQGY